MNILCVGFGFVGKAYALFLKERGHSIQVLTKDDNTFFEAMDWGFDQPKENSKFDVAIVAVPTPTINKKQDLSFLENALSESSNFKIQNVVVKSTVLPGNIKKLEKKYPFKRFIVYPEFLESNNPIGGVFNQECKVFGKGKWVLSDRKFVKTLFGFKEMAFTSLETACFLKYAHNLWLACNISFWNSIMRVGGKGIDFSIVLPEIHKSKYFGIHPWSIGKAFGGKCLPKDTVAFVSSIKKQGVFKRFLENIITVNVAVKKEREEFHEINKNANKQD